MSALMDDYDENSLVILVIGNLQREKSTVVDNITRNGSWDDRTTASGVRIFTHTNGDQVIDTTPLRNVQGRSPTAIARRWISQNSLRRIVQGRLVFVVCVVTGAIVEEPCSTAIFVHSNCWLDVLEVIFNHPKDTRKDIMVIARTEDESFTSNSKHLVKQCLAIHGLRPENVVFSSSGTVDTTRAQVKISHAKMPARFFDINGEKVRVVDKASSSEPTSYGKPFLLSKPSSATSGWDRFGPWGPERVFLFGRTGTGKSTLAQMLTSGKLDRNPTRFKAGSGIKGKTEVIEHGEGRGWYVVDTPAFGEPDCESSTVTTRVAQGDIKKYVEWKEGTFSHYLFMIKKGRVDQLEVKLWAFFKLLFGEKINHHFSVVVSNADQLWLKANISYLQEAFGGCSSFLTAEFPSNDDEVDEDSETEYQKTRAESLHMLEEELSKLARSDSVCEYGEHSKMHRLNEKYRTYIDTKVSKSMAVVLDIVGELGSASGLFTAMDDIVYRLSKALSGDKVIFDSL